MRFRLVRAIPVLLPVPPPGGIRDGSLPHYRRVGSRNFEAEITLGSTEPTSWYKVKDLNFPFRFAFGDLFDCFPVAFKSSLVQKAKRGCLFSDFVRCQNSIDVGVEVSLGYFDGSTPNLRLVVSKSL